MSEWRRILHNAFTAVAIVVFVGLCLLATASIVNSVARSIALRNTPHTVVSRPQRYASGDIVIIGVEASRTVGVVALRIDGKERTARGIAIQPDAFLDIPGVGYDRLSVAAQSGPDAVQSTVSNFLAVKMRAYVVVTSQKYRAMVDGQSVEGILTGAIRTNLDSVTERELARVLARVQASDVAIVAAPAKPMTLGAQSYLQPDREKVAGLLEKWWGIEATGTAAPVRAVVYNGAGVPGIAGRAARDLIAAGINVVGTQNADKFDYKATTIVVRHGDASVGETVRQALGVGEVSVDPSSQSITDVVVIIGSDYAAIKEQ